MALCKSADVHAGMLSSVRHALTAGASLSAETQEYIETCLGVTIVQWFGTTEVQLALSCSSCDIRVPLGSVGKIKPWTNAKVMWSF